MFRPSSTVPLSPTRPSPVDPGSNAGRYRVLEVLGRGAMGTVFRAFDTVLERHVALKSLHVQDARSRRRFVQEARAMAQLSHANVVEIFDVVRESTGAAFLAMELVEGHTLEQWLRVDRHWTEIRDVFVQAGRGLAAAHHAGMVHRDFKPANVLVDRRGRARVTDFGLTLTAEELAPTLDDAAGVEGQDREIDVTGAGLVVGTPAYMAPEQHRGAMLGPASDQFAFCAALFEALYGERPFDGRSCRELSQQKHLGRITRTQGRRSVPGWLRRVVLRGLRTDPSERFGSMDELLEALRGPAARRARWTRFTAAAALVLAGVGLGVATTSGHSGAGFASASAASSVPAVASLVSLDPSASAASAASSVPSSSSTSRRR